MPEPLPALCLIAMPWRRRRTIELSQEAKRRGFAGIYGPSPFGNMSMCEALSWNTASIPFGTAIAPIYQRSGTAKIDPLMAAFNAVAWMSANPASSQPNIFVI